jgi:hypothetical protein
MCVSCSDNHLCASSELQTDIFKDSTKVPRRHLQRLTKVPRCCSKMVWAPCCEQPVRTMTFSKIQQRFHDVAWRWLEFHVANSQCSSRETWCPSQVACTHPNAHLVVYTRRAYALRAKKKKNCKVRIHVHEESDNLVTLCKINMILKGLCIPKENN